ncbi:MAG TPA: PH domain-containing protein [Streptosporangiaceae bacterium]|nr:PH domain-containing protein [Streptosporangiaceae bacterium]
MQVYRSPRWALAIQTVVLSLMALIGVSIAFHPGDASHPGTAPGYIAFGIIIAAACIVLLIAQLTSRLVVTGHGLTWRSMMRTRSIGWADIDDILVVWANSAGPWYSPGVRAGGRLTKVNSVIGPRRYTQNIVEAIRQARPQPGAGTRAVPPA